jgi:hypothetical protein
MWRALARPEGSVSRSISSAHMVNKGVMLPHRHTRHNSRLNVRSPRTRSGPGVEPRRPWFNARRSLDIERDCPASADLGISATRWLRLITTSRALAHTKAHGKHGLAPLTC